jgi:integrase
MSAPKQPLNNHGSIMIRFSHKGKRFCMSKLGEYESPIALKYAQSICDRISVDIANNSFSCTNNQELTLKYNPTAIHTTITPTIIKNIETEKRIDLRQKCINKLQNSIKVTEKNTLSHLLKYDKKIYDKQDILLFADWLKKERKLSSASVARYFDVLKTIDDTFKTVTIQKENKPQPKPFTKDEVNKIIDWFNLKTNRAGKNDYYYYVHFLFLTGCRTSEAIGLRWKHIDFDNGVIYFYETLIRNNKGSSGNRIKGTTKKNIVRRFPINNKLLTLLNKLPKNNNEEDLVFTFYGHCINDREFRSKYWKPCLKECGIKYRKPYNTRHTFITHFLEQTKDVVKCAALTHGSKTGIKTIYEHYAGIINKIEVPDLF